MRTLLIGGALGVVVVSLAACGGSSTSSASEQAMQRQADLYAIDQIEKNFHQATSKKDIDLMMSLWAPNATFTVGPGRDRDRDEGDPAVLARRVGRRSSPETTGSRTHPAYKIRITVNGDRGTLHFECHYVDFETRQGRQSITAADQEVARIDGQWLITNMVGGSAPLTP